MVADVDAVSRWRLGLAATEQVLDWRSRRLNCEDAASLEIAFATGLIVKDGDTRFISPPSRVTRDFSNHPKLTRFRNKLLSRHLSVSEGLSTFVVLQDARLWTSIELMSFEGSAIAAQLSTSRPSGRDFSSSRSQHILWPANHEGPVSFVPSTPWVQRTEGIYWRGAISGSRFDLSGSGLPLLKGLRQNSPFLTTWLKQLSEGRADDWEVHARHYQRLIACIDIGHAPDVDIRMVDWPTEQNHGIMQFLERTLGPSIISGRLDRSDYIAMRRSMKYTLVLDGNDQPSSLREDLAGGGCLLMPKPYFETCSLFGLQAGVHYIELRRDLSDLEETLTWCRENDAICREIAENAKAHALTYFDGRFEDAVQQRVIERIKRATVVD